MSALMSRRRFGLAVPALVLGVRQAGAYPASTADRPLRLVVPFAAGSTPDLLARLLAQALADRLGRPVLPENRPGASGLLGAQLVAQAEPDGNTLLLAHSATLLDGVTQHARLPFDPVRDLRMVSQVATAPLMLVVHPDLPSGSGRDLIEHLSAVVEPPAYGSYGVGSQAHLAGALLGRIAATPMTHVPYRIEYTMLRDLVGDHIQLAFAGAAAARAVVATGRVRALGVTGSDRLATLPEVPTLVERGLDDEMYRATGWAGIAAPAGTPEPAVARLDSAIRAIGRDPIFRDQVALLGLEASTLMSDLFEARYLDELALWTRLSRSVEVAAE